MAGEDKSFRNSVLIAVGVTVLFVGAVFAVGIYGDSQLKPFDADEMLKKSYDTARAAQPDAKAIEVTAERVSPDGKVHLEERGALIVRFRYAFVPDPANATASPMLGAEYRAQGGCTGGVVRSQMTGMKRGSFEHQWKAENQKCLPELDGLPRCSFRQIWERARVNGAPERAYADIDLAQEAGGAGSEKRWRFEIVDRPDNSPPHVVFHAEFSDDCP